MALSDWIRDLKAFKAEVESTTRSLRQLDGQTGNVGVPSGTRSGYVSGVERGNNEHGSSMHSSPGMPIAFAAGAAMGQSSMQRMVENYEAFREKLQVGGTFNPSVNEKFGGTTFLPNKSQAAARAADPAGYMKAMEEFRQDKETMRSARLSIPGAPGPVTATPGVVGRTGVGGPPAPTSISRSFGRVVGKAGAQIQAWSGTPAASQAGMGAVGLGAFIGNKLHQQDDAYWAKQPWEERPRLFESRKDKFSYNDSAMGQAKDMASLLFQNLGEVVRTSSREISGYGGMIAGYKAYTSGNLARAGMKGFQGGKAWGGIQAVGVGAMIQTAINALPDAMEGGVALWNGTDTRTTRDFRRMARQLGQEKMFQDITRHLPGRQGGSMVTMNYLRAEADKEAQQNRGMFDVSSSFGKSDSLLRKLASWTPILGSMVKSERELMEEGAARAKSAAERWLAFKNKGWEAMSEGAYSKAKYNFEQLSMMSKDEQKRAAWKNPLVIFAACQEARMVSRHYAASFSTRNKERTGD